MLGQVEQFEVGKDENWQLYIEQLDQFFIGNEMDKDHKKVSVLLTVIEAKTYTLLRNLLAPEKSAKKG